MLGYASSWFVVTCILALIASSTMDDRATSEEFIALFLVLANAGILGLVGWLGWSDDKIDVYDEDEYG